MLWRRVAKSRLADHIRIKLLRMCLAIRKGFCEHPNGDMDIDDCGGAGVRRGRSGNEGIPE